MVREVSFEPVCIGWVACVPVMVKDWPPGTGNATGFPVTFPVWHPNRSRSEEIQRRHSRNALKVPDRDPGAFPIRATGSVPGSTARGKRGHGSHLEPRSPNTRTTNETLTTNDHYYPLISINTNSTK